MTLSPEARRQMDRAQARRRDTWDGKRPLAPTATTTTADLALINIGWQLWSCNRVDADLEGLGGIVTEELPDGVDDDTGELHRRWKVRNPYLAINHPHQLQIITTAELQIPEGVERPDRQAVTRMIRRLCTYVGAGSGWLTRYEIGAITDAWRLLGVIDK
ncbi:MAG TPA: hypothetical protein VLL25_15990 [Acidimicrobiales bacterium]|nr:hypothetical protein [Acidimicrobiales bacterium]